LLLISGAKLQIERRIKHDIYYIFRLNNRKKLSINFSQKIVIFFIKLIIIAFVFFHKNKNHPKKVVL